MIPDFSSIQNSYTHVGGFNAASNRQMALINSADEHSFLDPEYRNKAFQNEQAMTFHGAMQQVSQYLDANAQHLAKRNRELKKNSMSMGFLA